MWGGGGGAVRCDRGNGSRRVGEETVVCDDGGGGGGVCVCACVCVFARICFFLIE